MELITDRLTLREFNAEDFNLVHAYASNIENVKYMIWGPDSDEDTKNFIGECIKAKGKSPRLKYDFAITLSEGSEEGKLIGGCGIYLNDEQNTGMLGWILHMDYWKKGYMPEVGKALIEFGFNVLGLHRIYATCNADNYGSYRVMEKCGMRREAHFIKNRLGRVGSEQDVWYDEYHYAILREEFS